jgi:hypothetical protein
VKARYGNKISVGKPEGDTPIERMWCRWDDIIKVTLNKHGMRIYIGLKRLLIRSSNGIL